MKTFTIDHTVNTEKEKIGVAIAEKLMEYGHKAFFVGGYVRDILWQQIHAVALPPFVIPAEAGISANTSKSGIIAEANGVSNIINNNLDIDIDIATTAKPDEVLELFDDTRDFSKRFGVIMVLQKHFKFDVVTMREEDSYTDGRRPDQVTFTDNVCIDARRRDFTMNALYLNPATREVIDCFGGKEDFINKKLVFIGSDMSDQAKCAIERTVDEDYLRLLRAVRFRAQYQMEIDRGAMQVIEQHFDLVNTVSRERVRQELEKVGKFVLDDWAQRLIGRLSLG